MQTFSPVSINCTSTESDEIIEKYVEIMMDIINQKPKGRTLQSRKCSNVFYNKAKKTLYDLTQFHSNKKLAEK